MAKKNFLKKGVFITLEGPEGSGKTSHAKLLFKFLKRRGYDCVFTREPGGTAIGDRIRGILLGKKNTAMSDICEFLLFEASRAQIIEEVIAPALERKKVVISDRFGDATVAYQGFAAGLDVGFVRRLNAFAAKGIMPALTILLDVDPKLGLERAGKLRKRKLDRMESKSMSFHDRVRRGYLKLAEEEPARIKVFDANGRMEDVQKKIEEAVLKCLSGI